MNTFDKIDISHKRKTCWKKSLGWTHKSLELLQKQYLKQIVNSQIWNYFNIMLQADKFILCQDYANFNWVEMLPLKFYIYGLYSAVEADDLGNPCFISVDDPKDC